MPQPTKNTITERLNAGATNPVKHSPSSDTKNRYLFDNPAMAETAMRFSGLETTFDPSTIRVLTGVGVTGGWACWEIGAGGGSIARWLADRVGPMGSVLATDIDPRFIPPSQLSHLEVGLSRCRRRCDPAGSLRSRPRPAGLEPYAAAP